MRIGITFDLKSDSPQSSSRVGEDWDLPEDFQEEFDSPATIEALAAVLRDLGHEVALLGDGRELLDRLLKHPPDFVFNFAEGQGVGRAREARVPAVLEMLGIPYTGSDPLTLAATLDKDCAKKIVAADGIAVPWSFLLQPDDDLETLLARHEISLQNYFPVIAKPAWEGSSKGIHGKCFVQTPAELPQVLASLRSAYRQPILVEEYIQGDELTVGLLGNDPPSILGVMRVVPNYQTDAFVYSLEIKREFRRLVRYECPAPLTPDDSEAVEQAALLAYRALGCRDVSRIDFRLRDGVPYFLEVNPLPGLNPESSDLVIMANLLGWSYPRLIETILNAALERLALSIPVAR